MSRALAAILLIGTLPAAAQAQDRTGVSQIAGPAGTVEPAEVPAETTEAPPQISGERDSSPNQAQLTSAAASPEQPAQVATRSRDPQAPEPLSTPQEGRTAVVEPVNGNDKCDPADGSEKGSLPCKRVIENRAAEYRRPPPTQLSPEQKLMIDQQLRSEEGASQRLAQSGDPESDLDSMGIASVVISQRDQQGEDAKKQEQDQQTQAAMQALITVLQNGGSPNE